MCLGWGRKKQAPRKASFGAVVGIDAAHSNRSVASWVATKGPHISKTLVYRCFSHDHHMTSHTPSRTISRSVESGGAIQGSKQCDAYFFPRHVGRPPTRRN